MKQVSSPAVLLSLLLLVSCGGGGGGVSSVAQAPSLIGVFLDSPVAGLGYETGSGQGITDAAGQFSYHEGEMIRFFVGDIELGQTMARPLVTPMHLVDGAGTDEYPMATNMLVFLQTLDADGEPANGIQITAPMRQEASGMQVDFSGDPVAFMADYDLNHFLELLNQGDMFSDHMDHAPVAVNEAWAHMQTTMDEYGLAFPGMTPPETILPDGGGPMAGRMP